MNKEKAANITNLTLGTIMSMDELVSAYFSHNDEVVKSAIATHSKNPEEMFNALAKMNYEIENEQLLTQESSYGEAQRVIVEQIANPETLGFFQTNIISSEQVLGEPSKGLADAKDVIVNLKEQNLTVQNQMIKQ